MVKLFSSKSSWKPKTQPNDSSLFGLSSWFSTRFTRKKLGLSCGIYLYLRRDRSCFIHKTLRYVKLTNVSCTKSVGGLVLPTIMVFLYSFVRKVELFGEKRTPWEGPNPPQLIYLTQNRTPLLYLGLSRILVLDGTCKKHSQYQNMGYAFEKHSWFRESIVIFCKKGTHREIKYYNIVDKRIVRYTNYLYDSSEAKIRASNKLIHKIWKKQLNR